MRWMAADEKELVRRSRKLIGIDLDWEGLIKNSIISGRVYGNLQALPFDDNSFDLVTANMVVEHLEHPELVLKQVHRVLRPDGRFIFHTPNVRSEITRVSSRIPRGIKKPLIRILEHRKEEDVFVTAYRLSTFGAICVAAAANAFRVDQVSAVSTSAMTAALGRIAIPELLYLRVLEMPALEQLGSNLPVVLQKAA